MEFLEGPGKKVYLVLQDLEETSECPEHLGRKDKKETLPLFVLLRPHGLIQDEGGTLEGMEYQVP